MPNIVTSCREGMGTAMPSFEKEVRPPLALSKERPFLPGLKPQGFLARVL